MFAKTKCDRCGTKIDDSKYMFAPRFFFCGKCSQIKPKEIRVGELRIFDKNTKKKEKSCSYCGTSSDKYETTCYDCGSDHIDDTHHQYKTLPDYPKGNKEVVVQEVECWDCGGVRVAKRTKNSIRFTYYKLGSTEKHSKSYKCPNYGIDHLSEKRKKCTHDWFVIADHTHPYKPVHFSAGAKRMYGLTKSDEIYASYGFRVNWCSKCGFFNKYCPKLTPLPVKGD